MRRAPVYIAIFSAGMIVSAAARAQPLEPQQPFVVAQSSDPFSALVGKKRTRRQERSRGVTIERYVLASDDRALLFEDRSNEARVQFLCGAGDPRLDCTIDTDGPAAEIYRLNATRGPRGDIIYKDVEGHTLLRIASYGGATVFWPGEDRGLAASKSFGDDAALKLVDNNFGTAQRRAQAGTAIVSAATGAPIIFDIGQGGDGANKKNATVLADAVVRAAKGIKDVAVDPTGARIIASRINKVMFLEDEAPNIFLNEGVLMIHYVPDRDVDGRPSSAAVARFLEETL